MATVNVLSDDFRPTEQLQARAGVEAYFRLCEAWNLSDDISARIVSVDADTWYLMKIGKWKGHLNEEQKIRIGALFELYQGLHHFFGEPIADQWVTMNNKGPLFHGKKPIQVMLENGLPTMVEVVNYVDGLVRR